MHTPEKVHNRLWDGGGVIYLSIDFVTASSFFRTTDVKGWGGQTYTPHANIYGDLA